MPSIQFRIHTTLSLDAAYYHAARSNYDFAVACEPKIKQAESDYNDLVAKESTIKRRYSRRTDKAYPKLERVAIAIESQETEIGLAYGPFLQHLAIVHILSAACMEAHINIRAKELLKGHFYDTFESMSLESKWLFLPKIIGSTGFEPRAEPFQGFAQLVKYRNELVHYKSKREKWSSPGGVPEEFMKKLGLNLKAAERSLRAVKGMITAFSEEAKSEMPYWLNAKEGGYFQSEIVVGNTAV